MQNWYEPISTSRATGVQSCDLYKVLRKCQVVLENTTLVQSTTPVLIRYYSVLQVTTHPPLQRPDSSHPGDAFSTKKYHISRSCYLPKCHELLRLPRKVTLQLHQILRLPRKMNLMIDPGHMWNVIYNARSKQSQPRTSPNTAPATQNESHDWSGPHVKRHLQWAEQAKSPCNLTKYCACHAKWISWLIRVTFETSFTMHGASKVNLEPHQILHLTKYCTCPAKWMSSVICVTNETSFPMRRASKVTVQPHQILRLPRKMNLMIDPGHIWNVIYNARSKQSQPRTSANTAPATQNECHQRSASEM